MDNTVNPQSEQDASDRVKAETASAQAASQPQSERRILDALRDGVRRGADDARTAAEKAIPKVKSAAADAVYWTAYGASFTVVFHWAMAKGLAPESLKCGLRDGVKGGKEAAEKWLDRLRQRKEKASAPSPEPTGPSTETVQPGAV